jgi:hypothetical protein
MTWNGKLSVQWKRMLTLPRRSVCYEPRLYCLEEGVVNCVIEGGQSWVVPRSWECGQHSRVVCCCSKFKCEWTLIWGNVTYTVFMCVSTFATKFELTTSQVLRKLAVRIPCSVASNAAKELKKPLTLYFHSIVWCMLKSCK